MRSLAHIEQIKNIRPIEGCDNICQCNVLGWNLIIKKDEFNVGDKCVYIEIDSIVPSDMECFQFLEKKHFKVRTMRMKGTISQGLALPLSILPSDKCYKLGDDVTEVLKIKQIEDELPIVPQLNKNKMFEKRFPKFTKNKIVKLFMRFKWFRELMFYLFVPKTKAHKFPNWIVKTDETRLQSNTSILEKYKDIPMIVTEKLDGTSATFAIKRLGKNKFDIAVCSRNVRQTTRSTKACYFESNVYWEIYDKYSIESVLKHLIKDNDTVVLQGEIIGESIQSNKYKIKGREFYAFNLIINGVKVNSKTAFEILEVCDIKFVPILDCNFKLLNNVEDMITFADGNSVIGDTLREGLVIRTHNNDLSFKCISNKFLLKYNL